MGAPLGLHHSHQSDECVSGVSASIHPCRGQRSTSQTSSVVLHLIPVFEKSLIEPDQRALTSEGSCGSAPHHWGDGTVLYCPTLTCVGNLAQVLMSQIITPTPSLWSSSLSFKYLTLHSKLEGHREKYFLIKSQRKKLF